MRISGVAGWWAGRASKTPNPMPGSRRRLTISASGWLRWAAEDALAPAEAGRATVRRSPARPSQSAGRRGAPGSSPGPSARSAGYRTPSRDDRQPPTGPVRTGKPDWSTHPEDPRRTGVTTHPLFLRPDHHAPRDVGVKDLAAASRSAYGPMALKTEAPGWIAAQVAVVLAAHAGWAPSARTLQRHFAALGISYATNKTIVDASATRAAVTVVTAE
jgi:hypothetical protein